MYNRLRLRVFTPIKPYGLSKVFPKCKVGRSTAWPFGYIGVRSIIINNILMSWFFLILFILTVYIIK